MKALDLLRELKRALPGDVLAHLHMREPDVLVVGVAIQGPTVPKQGRFWEASLEAEDHDRPAADVADEIAGLLEKHRTEAP